MHTIDFLGHQLRSPIIAASGPPSMDFASVKRLSDAGIGSVITKTILVEPSNNPKPCLYRGSRLFLNTERCSTLPLGQWLESELPQMAQLPIPIIASIGMTPDEAAALAGPVVDAGADMLELSIFTPVDDPQPMVEAIQRVRAQVDVPILCKLSCNVADVVAFARAFEKAGADAVSAIDALKAAMILDPVSGEPVVFEQGFARMSGEALHPVALYHVSQVANYTGLSIVGTGGISSGQDIVDMVSCGAQVVGVCSHLIVEGHDAVDRLNLELEEALQRLGVDHLSAIQGRTLQMIDFTDDEEERQEYEKRESSHSALRARVIAEPCIGCGKCDAACPYSAISVLASNVRQVIGERCEGCGLCVSLCPVSAIEWTKDLE